MDAKYLAEIRARGQMAKAEKQKGNDLDCACLSWAIVLNDLPALLAEVEQNERDKAAQYMEIVRLREQVKALRNENAAYEKILDGIRPNVKLQKENVAKDKQIAILERILKIVFTEFGHYLPHDMDFYIQQAEQEGHDEKV